jgi:hypothetical protein
VFGTGKITHLIVLVHKGDIHRQVVQQKPQLLRVSRPVSRSTSLLLSVSCFLMGLSGSTGASM